MRTRRRLKLRVSESSAGSLAGYSASFVERVLLSYGAFGELAAGYASRARVPAANADQYAAWQCVRRARLRWPAAARGQIFELAYDYYTSAADREWQVMRRGYLKQLDMFDGERGAK